MTRPFDHVIEIAPALRRLRESLNEARWSGDRKAEEQAAQEIARLEMLARYGETHDMPF